MSPWNLRVWWRATQVNLLFVANIADDVLWQEALQKEKETWKLDKTNQLFKNT